MVFDHPEESKAQAGGGGVRPLSQQDYSSALDAILLRMKETALGLSVEVQAKIHALPPEAGLRKFLESWGELKSNKDFLNDHSTPETRKNVSNRLSRARHGGKGRFNENRMSVLSDVFSFIEEHHAWPELRDLGYQHGSAVYVEACEELAELEGLK